MTNVEAMCRAGLVFENACFTPIRSLTRAMLMSGRYGGRTDLGGAIPPRATNGLSDESESLFHVPETGPDHPARLR